MFRVVVGGLAFLVGAVGFAQTLWVWKRIDFLKQDDLISTGAVMVVGAAIAAWGWRRRSSPAQWIELDLSARLLTLGLGGPLRTVPFHALGTLEVKQTLVPIKRGYVKRWEVRASGVPEVALFVSGWPEKANARKAELDALLK
jgi:hypothetical protein